MGAKKAEMDYRHAILSWLTSLGDSNGCEEALIPSRDAHIANQLFISVMYVMIASWRLDSTERCRQGLQQCPRSHLAICRGRT
jgi:hypothetical protein